MIFKQWMYKAAPTILAITSCAGVIFTAYQSAKDTPKAMERLKKAEEEKGEELTTMEKITTAAPCYIRTGAAVVTTCGMMLTSDAMSRSQKAKLAATIVAAEQTAERVAKKTDELYGEGASDNVKYELLKEDYEKLKNDYENKINGVFYLDGYGYFKSTDEDVWCAYADLLQKFHRDGIVTIGDFVDFITNGREYHDSRLDRIGWTDNYMFDCYESYDFIMNTETSDDYPGVKFITFDEPAIADLQEYCDHEMDYDYISKEPKLFYIGIPKNTLASKT